MWTKILLFYDAMNLSTAHLHTLKNGIFLLFCQQKPITHVKSCSSKIILCGMYFQMNNNNINPLPPFFYKYRFTFTEVCIEKYICNHFFLCSASSQYVRSSLNAVFLCQHWLMFWVKIVLLAWCWIIFFGPIHMALRF